ncbi:hypothetical protein [Ruegeria sp. EL01]|uniref:hypothetical protein n=1 Tax=Ruegeria sp. EL01 TaxID=2107578 RepID=UPI000EA80CEE|nr:hypothetical protein [Ruegeria sp. EL01]
MSNNAKTKFLRDMRDEAPVQSYLATHLNWMREENPDGAEQLHADIIETFTTEQGLRVLKLLEKSVLYAGVPNGSSDGALREMNAVRNFVLEIRRLVSHG